MTVVISIIFLVGRVPCCLLKLTVFSQVFMGVIVSVVVSLVIGTDNLHNFYIIEPKIQKTFLEAQSILFYDVYISVGNICQPVQIALANVLFLV